MPKRLAIALLSLSVIAFGSATLAGEAYATHTCKPIAGCNDGIESHSGIWSNCDYTCPGWDPVS